MSTPQYRKRRLLRKAAQEYAEGHGVSDMTRNEAAYLAAFLGQFVERLGSDGCNDFSLPDTPENRKLVLGATPSEDDELRIRDGRIRTMNWLVVGQLRSLVMTEHALTDADLPEV